MELQGRIEEIRKQGLGLAAISYDPPEILAAFSRQRGIAFPLLSDLGSETIKRYGLLNTVAEEAVGPTATDPAVQEDVKKYVSMVGANAGMVGMAFPGTFVLDREGRVKSRFSIALEVTPKPRIHVYAPGASGYRVIGVTIAPQPFVRILPLEYPKSETYFFKPLNERVPVYAKPFTLVQELILEGYPEAQAALRGKESVTLAGTLDYQACDDKVCFNPTSVPLAWTLPLRPLIRERPASPR